MMSPHSPGFAETDFREEIPAFNDPVSELGSGISIKKKPRHGHVEVKLLENQKVNLESEKKRQKMTVKAILGDT